MKKVLFLSLAVALFASCSNDETVEMQQKSAIGFDTFVNKTARNAATDITANNIENFAVYSWQDEKLILTKEEVNKTINNSETLEGMWSYANTQYWAASSTYNFYAIAPYNGTGDDAWTYTATNNAAGSLNLVAKDGLTDLLYDNLTATCTDPASMSAQKFEFNHLLSRVRFGFTESFANENITVKVTNLKISNHQINGLYDGSTWTTQNETGTYTFDTDNLNSTNGFSTTNSAKQYSAHLYMIPCTQSFKITFEVEAFQDGKSIVAKNEKTVQITDFTMEIGKSYEFVTNFDATNTGETTESMNPIKFTCSVTGWVDSWTEKGFETPAE